MRKITLTLTGIMICLFLLTHQGVSHAYETQGVSSNSYLAFMAISPGELKLTQISFNYDGTFTMAFDSGSGTYTDEGLMFNAEFTNTAGTTYSFRGFSLVSMVIFGFGDVMTSTATNSFVFFGLLSSLIPN